MIRSDLSYNKIFDAVNRACQFQKATSFVFGNYILYEITGIKSFLKENVIKFILVSDDFDVQKFYNVISGEIVVNSEIENSGNKYIVLSDNHVLDFTIVAKFDPKNPDDIKTICDFTIDCAFKNLSDGLIEYSSDDYKKHFAPDFVIQPIRPHSDWDASYILRIAKMYGEHHSSKLPQAELNFLSSLDLFELRGSDIYELFISVLLSNFPGKSLSVIKNTKNGHSWLFSRILDVVIRNNIPINEDVDVKNLLNDKKSGLLNVYNEFFLSEIKDFETPKDRTKRLSTTLRLLVDSPSDVSLPYIDKVSLMSASIFEEEQVKLFDADPCTYGPCPECNPENCSPSCCCCHSIDIISAVRTRCHKRAVLSCNADGSGPAPGESFTGCPDCMTACQTILGLRSDLEGESCDNFTSIGQGEGWWTIPISNWPCECSCAQPGGSGCELTCVTCNDLFCESNVSVTGNDCNYNISMTPGPGCCGDVPTEEMVFVVEITQPATVNGLAVIPSDTIALVRIAVDNILAVTNRVRFGLVTFLDTHPDSDQYGIRYAIPLTDPGDFTSQLPSTMQSGDANNPNGPYRAHWYAGVRAIQETNWSANSNKTVYFIAGGNFKAGDFAEGTHPPICIDDPANPTDSYNCTTTFRDMCIIQNIQFGTLLSNSYPWSFPDERNIDCFINRNCSGYENIDRCYNAHWWATEGLTAPALSDQFFFFTGEPGVFADCIESTGYGFPSNCDCINTTPVPIRRQSPECMCCKDGVTDPCVDDPFDFDCINSLPESCFDIPITKCLPGAPCDCSIPFALNVCGSTVVIEPAVTNAVCCSDLGFGCDCDSGGTPGVEECCGPQCFDVCAMYQQLSDVEELIDFIWSDCWTKKAGIDLASTPNCSDPCCPDPSDPESNDYPCELREPGSALPCCPCSLENQNDCCNCCIRFIDTDGSASIVYCRQDIAAQVREAVALCTTSPPPPPPWNPPNQEPQNDRCVVGEPVVTPEKGLDDQCDNIHKGCTAVKHPSVVVLNNGIGLVAYESFKDVSTIKVQQFKTSLKNKVLPNREFNFGRLQNQSRWTNNTAKLYIYDDLPTHLLTGIDAFGDEEVWKDAIAFKNGPLEKQFFPLTIPPTGSDSTGKYVQFFVPTDVALTNPFPNPDDVYDAKFFIFNFEDEGVIGDSTDTQTDGSSFDIINRSMVDEALLLNPHIYNGNPVPCSYPNIATAYNYSEPTENSHFVYLTYQAFEDSKWNVYMRQLRLSEYQKSEQISSAVESGNIVSLTSLDINEVVYRIVCTNDNCAETGEGTYTLSRSMTFEVLLPDGRDVLNPGLSGFWNSLCVGHSTGEFPKEKVFVQFTHSVVADRCPDSSGFNSIFFSWRVGQEFLVPFSEVSPEELYTITTAGGTVVEIGDFTPSISIGDIEIFSSFVGGNWHRNINETTWSVISDSSFSTLKSYKGFDISEPIKISEDDEGHSTRPVVKVNYNNDVFIVYECTESKIQQIKIAGTAVPTSSLPIGIYRPKDPDKTLNYFLSPSDFVYRSNITLENQGINQLPDMFIDYNDVIHLAWQSNRDNRWEIYYANSETNFTHKRITNHTGRSLSPSIVGDNEGRIFVAWHDDRFGNDGHEIMIAYYPGDRTIPLFQQDPYLASIRNAGYSHYIDEIPLTLSNQTGSTICVRNIIVDFYEDRTLTQFAFSISQESFGYAFTVPDAQFDTTVYTFTNFTDWTDLSEYDPYADQTIITSPEFDTTLSGSVISALTVDFDSFETTFPAVELSFRASDTPNDPESFSQWTDWVVVSPATYKYSSFGIDSVSGRYKQVRARLSYLSTPPSLTLLTIESELRSRMCIAPGESISAMLDLTPSIRVDKFGIETVEMPIPVAFVKNQTYFIRVKAVTDAGGVISMPNPLVSASCETCTGKDSSWNFESCSIKYDVINDSDFVKYYNFKFTFYYDSNKTRKVLEMNLVPSSADLKYFTVNDGQPANEVWTERGLTVDPQSTATLVFWPNLSITSGLLCGVDYYVDISDCSLAEHEDAISCDESLLSIKKSTKWVCNCMSPRWDSVLENAPVNLIEATRWFSSGDGFSDTRLTETVGIKNLNPIVRIRSNQNGVIIYETNRSDDGLGVNSDPGIYRIYASVFSIVPNSEMYASGAQSIVSQIESIVHRSDIPICENKDGKFGCYDENKQRINDTIIGRNAAMALDQYDNLFLSVEKEFINSEGEHDCRVFQKDKQQIILVHTAGADALDLFENFESQPEESEQCDAKEITSKAFDGSIDSIFRQTVLKLRVNNDYVSYHITKNNITMPVVKTCAVRLTAIGMPETVAIRVRNSDSDWSEWMQMNPELGENAREFDWTLSPGIGIKLVQFQAATQSGLSNVGLLNILADYEPVSFKTKFYKPLSLTPFPPETPSLEEASIWLNDNVLPTFSGFAVASTRPPKLENNNVLVPSSDYIFVEIIPNAQYMSQFSNISDETKAAGSSGIEPTFDYIQQGSADEFNKTTIWKRNAEGIEVFRGVIQVNKNNQGTYIDGFARIIPHFKDDCADVLSQKGTEDQFTKDKLNVFASQDLAATTFDENRDDYGKIQYSVVIRPDADDPYFIFGDPDYRLKSENG